MRLFELNNSDKLLLSTSDIANLLSLNKGSAKVTASRYTQKGFLIRIKKDCYILSNKFDYLKEEDLFRLANIIQTPSYVSLTTALSYYNITTQQTINYIESIAIKRTKNVVKKNIEFTFTRIKEELYGGFELKDNFFIALPEKAFADAVYLTSFKKYNCDFNAVNFDRIDKKKVEQYLIKSNYRTKDFWDKLCKIYKI